MRLDEGSLQAARRMALKAEAAMRQVAGSPAAQSFANMSTIVGRLGASSTLSASAVARRLHLPDPSLGTAWTEAAATYLRAAVDPLEQLSASGSAPKAAWQTLSNLASSFRSPLFARAVRNFEEHARLSLQFPVAMADLGWPSPPAASIKLMQSVIEAHMARGAEAKLYVDGLVLAEYDEAAVREILDWWTQRPACHRRSPILKEALAAHLDGSYFCSVPVLLAQCEGIVAEGMHHVGQMSGGDYVKYVGQLAADDDDELQAAVDNAVFSLLSSVVLAPFEHGKPVKSPLSRHAILHGADVAYGTQTSSLKALLLFHYLQDHFDYGALASSAVYHRTGCPRLATIRGALELFRTSADAESAGKRACRLCQSAGDGV